MSASRSSEHGPLPGGRERCRQVDPRQDADRARCSPTSGTMTVRGASYQPRGPHDARAGGIATLFQELHVVDQLTVQENLTLGMERTRFGFLVTVRASTIASSRRWRPSSRPSIPSARVSTLSVAQKQIVEIARAASSGASVIIMDEPTAALSEREVERLFGVIRRLRESDVTVVYISHKLDEIFELGDAVTVLRDGRHIATKPLAPGGGPLGADRDDDRPHRLPRATSRASAPRDAPTVLTAEHLTQPAAQGRVIRHRRGRGRRASTGWSAPARRRSPGRSSVPTGSPGVDHVQGAAPRSDAPGTPSPRASRSCPRSVGRRASSPVSPSAGTSRS